MTNFDTIKVLTSLGIGELLVFVLDKISTTLAKKPEIAPMTNCDSPAGIERLYPNVNL